MRSDNGLSPGRRQVIIRTNAQILLIRPLGTKFSETSMEIKMFSFKKMRLKMSSGKWRPSCLGLNVLSAAYNLISVQIANIPRLSTYRWVRYEHADVLYICCIFVHTVIVSYGIKNGCRLCVIIMGQNR